MIDLAILGLLDEQDLHGYELKKQLAELVGARSGVSFGSLYPALARLEKGGAVKAVEAHTADATIPMTGALSGEIAAFRARLGRPAKGRRTKKVYGITEVGRRRLGELLIDDATDDRTFARAGRVLPAPCSPSSGSPCSSAAAPCSSSAWPTAPASADGRTDTYRSSLREHDTRTITHDLAWIDELIGAARAELAASGGSETHLNGGTHP